MQKMNIKRNTKTKKKDGKEPAAYSAVRVQQLEIIIPYLLYRVYTTVMLLMHLSFVYF